MEKNKQTLEEKALELYPHLINDPYNPEEDDNEEYRNIWLAGARSTLAIKLDKKTLLGIIKETLHPGTDKGSTQAIIDTKDLDKLAERLSFF